MISVNKTQYISYSNCRHTAFYIILQIYKKGIASFDFRFINETNNNDIFLTLHDKMEFVFWE